MKYRFEISNVVVGPTPNYALITGRAIENIAELRIERDECIDFNAINAIVAANDYSPKSAYLLTAVLLCRSCDAQIENTAGVVFYDYKFDVESFEMYCPSRDSIVCTVDIDNDCGNPAFWLERVARKLNVEITIEEYTSKKHTRMSDTRIRSVSNGVIEKHEVIYRYN